MGRYFRAKPILSGFVAWSGFLPNRTKFASLQQSAFGRVDRIRNRAKLELIGPWDGFPSKANFERVRCVEWVLPNRIAADRPPALAEFSKQSQLGGLVDGTVLPSKANFEAIGCVKRGGWTGWTQLSA
jgi:hypothetical protein